MENNNEFDIEVDEIVTLQDEDGNEVGFNHLMTIEHEGSFYIALEEVEDDDEVMLLKIAKDEESGEDIYLSIDDEEEFNLVLAKCIEALEEDIEYEFVEAEDIDEE